MKPHCNYSDKAYTITYSRSKAMFEFVDNSDCLLVIGSGLETNFTKSIIEAFLDRQVPVIEVNLQTCIDHGYNIQVLDEADVALPLLFTEFYRLMNVKATKKSEKAIKKQVKKVDARISEFQQKLDALLKAKTDAAFGLIRPVSLEHKLQPKKCEPREAAKFMVGRRKFAVLTGPGLSGASNVPILRGQSDFWSKKYAGINDSM